MKRFSWFTIIHPDWHEGEPPLFRLVGPAILPDERTCDIYFKPNRKGGHRHNHVKNAMARMRSCKECGDPIVKGMEARIELPLVRGRDDTMCRRCLRMLDEEIYHHNYLTVKEIEMMEADL